MKLLVFSDTHGQIERCAEVVERERPQMLLHLGDLVRDAEQLSNLFPQLPMRCVCGNCDFSRGAPLTETLEVGGVTLFLCHGHTLSVKSGATALVRAARERGAQVALYGHTHRSRCEMIDGIWVLNPGSLSEPRGCPPGYGVVRIENGRAEPRAVPYR